MAAPGSVRRNFAGRPDSVTVAGSFAGSHMVALVFGGTVTSSVKWAASRVHEVAMVPYIDLCDAFTKVRSPAGIGWMMARWKPGCSGAERLPARYSYIQTARSPICITWLPEFMAGGAGSAVSPFHSSQIVVAPFSAM